MLKVVIAALMLPLLSAAAFAQQAICSGPSLARDSLQ